MRFPSLSRSVRHALRRLMLARGFTAATILTLALGIGATSAAFSVVNAVLLRPLPYPEPERLVAISHSLVVGGTLQVEQSDASLLFYRRHNNAFSAFGGYRVTAAALGPVGGADAERVSAARVMGGLFPALGVAPLRGRALAEADEQQGAPPVVVIGQGLWERKFASDPGILNRSLHVDGVAHEVVGIMPRSLRFPASDIEMWLPMRLQPANTDSATFDYYAVARLRDGVPRAAAEADLQTLLPRLPDEFPGRLTRTAIERTEMRAVVRPLADIVIGDVGRLLWIVLGAAFFVLAIATANVANLFLVRAEGRRNAIAVERALGATAIDIALEFFWEGMLVAAVASVLGAMVAMAGVEAVRWLGGAIDLPRVAEVGLDAAVLGFLGITAIGAALIASAIPMLRTTGSSGLLAALANRAATADRTRHRVRHALVIAQVALALILLVGSGLMARSVWHLRSVEPGFDPERAMTFRLALSSASYPAPDDAVRFYLRFLDVIASVPGIRQAAVVSKLPLDEQGRTDTAVFIEGRPIPPGTLPGIHPVVYATPGYFAAAGIPLLSGRTFTSAEPPRVVLEAVVSRAFAERYWKGESPLGKRVRIISNGPFYIVVGEVSNVRDRALDRPADEMIYCPLLPPREDPRWSPRDLALVVRTGGNPAAVTAPARDALRRLDPSLPLHDVRPLAEVVAEASARRQITFALIGCASLVALTLGAIGLYGVMSYVMALRTREIAIRLALGARPGEVRRMVALQGLRVAAAGIVIGLAGAAMLTRFLAALLYGISPTDPPVLVTAAVLLLVVAAAASWLPTRRTTAIDAASALRAE